MPQDDVIRLFVGSVIKNGIGESDADGSDENECDCDGKGMSGGHRRIVL